MRAAPLTHGDCAAPSRAPDPAAPPLYVTRGPVLLRLCTWTERQWAALPACARPAEAYHAPGRGWVGVVPAGIMN